MFGHSKNILLLGVDSNGEGTDKWNGTRTDTIILMNIDPKSHSVNAISIPRDSKVYIEGHDTNKINSAHAFGGIRLCKKTVEDTLGVRVDKYIMVHDDAVKDITKVNNFISKLRQFEEEGDDGGSDEDWGFGDDDSEDNEDEFSEDQDTENTEDDTEDDTESEDEDIEEEDDSEEDQEFCLTIKVI